MSQAPNTPAQSRRWTITIWFDDDIPEDQELSTLPGPEFGPDCRYSVSQLEACPDTGRVHFQAYAEFVRPKRLAAIKKLIQPRKFHAEPSRGDGRSNRDYCTKV